MTDTTPRWVYRFENYKKALALLVETVEKAHAGEIDDFILHAMVQRFEMTVELGWKVMKDYLQHAGHHIKVITPMAVIRQAAAAHIIENAAVWMQAIETRNKLSHTYDEAVFREGCKKITDSYYQEFKALENFIHAQVPDA
jgi:nucleotidyltransferase substrate binding protein (TIGR01987 family)